MEMHQLRENDRRILCDDNRVFELGRDGAVDCADRPTILLMNSAPHPRCEERLNGQHQPLMQNSLVVRIVEVEDFFRALVQTAANTMSGEIINDVVTTPVGLPLNGSTDRIKQVTRFCRVHRFHEGCLGSINELLQGAITFVNDQGGSRVGKIAIQLCRDVDMDELALLQDMLARDPVRDDRRYTNARCSWIVVTDLRSGMRTFRFE